VLTDGDDGKRDCWRQRGFAGAANLEDPPSAKVEQWLAGSKSSPPPSLLHERKCQNANYSGGGRLRER
jgi:hypothetical protein